MFLLDRITIFIYLFREKKLERISKMREFT